MTTHNPLYPIDYSRGPLWWFSVAFVLCDGSECLYRTFVRAGDYEAAKGRAERIRGDLKNGARLVPQVRPMLNRSGLSRGTHEFAGYGDE